MQYMYGKQHLILKIYSIYVNATVLLISKKMRTTSSMKIHTSRF